MPNNRTWGGGLWKVGEDALGRRCPVVLPEREKVKQGKEAKRKIGCDPRLNFARGRGGSSEERQPSLNFALLLDCSVHVSNNSILAT